MFNAEDVGEFLKTPNEKRCTNHSGSPSALRTASVWAQSVRDTNHCFLFLQTPSPSLVACFPSSGLGWGMEWGGEWASEALGALSSGEVTDVLLCDSIALHFLDVEGRCLYKPNNSRDRGTLNQGVIYLGSTELGVCYPGSRHYYNGCPLPRTFWVGGTI